MGFVLKKNFSKYISKFLFDFILRTKNLTGNDFYLTVKKPLDYLVILVFSYLSISQIDLSIILNNFPIFLGHSLSKIFSFLIMILVIWLLLRITEFFKLIMIKKAEKTKSKLDDQLIPFIISLIKILIIVFGLFTIAGNIFNINM